MFDNFKLTQLCLPTTKRKTVSFMNFVCVCCLFLLLFVVGNCFLFRVCVWVCVCCRNCISVRVWVCVGVGVFCCNWILFLILKKRIVHFVVCVF